jgi:hypothetical protein
VLNLGEVSVRIAVVDEGVEEFGGFPDSFLALLEREVLLLLAEDVVDCLVLVVLAIELGYAGGGLGIVYPEFFLALALFVAAGEKTIPFFEIVKGVIGIGGGCAVECDAHEGLLRGREEDGFYARVRLKLTSGLAGCKFR